MGIHFLGIKRLTKISKKYGCFFINGYEYTHKKGYKIYILIDIKDKQYAFLITKNKENVLRKLPDDFGDKYEDCFAIDIDYKNNDLFLRV